MVAPQKSLRRIEEPLCGSRWSRKQERGRPHLAGSLNPETSPLLLNAHSRPWLLALAKRQYFDADPGGFKLLPKMGVE